MARAIEAATRVRGFTSPNPNVGAALVMGERVVAVGATAPYPGAHAEAQVLEDGVFPGATLYVTLEPCTPFAGKRTPPCSEAIIKARIGRVVVAMEDSDPNVRGRGIARLREAGVTVEAGDGGEEVARLLRPYTRQRQTGMPYVIAKFAATLDGRTATASGDSKWITGETARNRGHEQRAWVDAVIVGSGTVIADDPSLTARPGGLLSPRQPVRIILDGRGRIPAQASVFGQPGITIVATTRASSPAWRASITSAGGTILECEPADPGVNMQQLMRVLGARGILSVWVEGGPQVLGSLFDEGLVNETWAFIAPKILGGDARTAVAGLGVPFVADAHQLREIQVERLGDDVLVRGYTGEWEPR